VAEAGAGRLDINDLFGYGVGFAAPRRGVFSGKSLRTSRRWRLLFVRLPFLINKTDVPRCFYRLQYSEAITIQFLAVASRVVKTYHEYLHEAPFISSLFNGEVRSGRVAACFSVYD
jgi:hypothetical protein